MPSLENKLRLLKKTALAYFKDKKILMVRDNSHGKVFLHLGGKVEKGETDKDSLRREVREELEVNLQMNSLKFLAEFEAPAHAKENTLVNIHLYEGDFTGKPRTTEEIVEFKYLDSSADPEILTEITREKIFPWLKEQGYIN